MDSTEWMLGTVDTELSSVFEQITTTFKLDKIEDLTSSSALREDVEKEEYSDLLYRLVVIGQRARLVVRSAADQIEVLKSGRREDHVLSSVMIEEKSTPSCERKVKCVRFEDEELPSDTGNKFKGARKSPSSERNMKCVRFEDGELPTETGNILQGAWKRTRDERRQLKNWTISVKENCCRMVSAGGMTDVVKAIVSEDKNTQNLILFNVEELEYDLDRLVRIETLVDEILRSVLRPETSLKGDIVSCYRVGPSTDETERGQPRPIKVKISISKALIAMIDKAIEHCNGLRKTSYRVSRRNGDVYIY